MRRLLLCVSLFLSPVCFQSLLAKGLDMLVVELKSDTSYNFSLNVPPRFMLNDGRLEVEGDLNTSFAVSDVRQVYFAPSAEVGVSKVDGRGDVTISYVDNSRLQVNGVNPDAKVCLYTVDGKLLGEKSASGDVVEVQLPNVAGIYMLQVNGRTFKVRKR
ncbi:MAG: hypothetical protein J6Y22_12465 [Paludibacteraceae bacterium]|nr:hypothetical protein [Paludibacteraceae bacterium]